MPHQALASQEIARYRLVREVGRGAMGVVYEAEHRELGKRVALKLLHPSLRGNAVAEARFVREGRVGARLAHPHIVEVLDAGTDSAGPYLVMELVDGPTLAASLRASGAMPFASAVEIVLPVLSALGHAHAEGVVHRDVKPANVLLARDRAGGLFPKVSDFGIGKYIGDDRDASLTRGGMVGSVPYMAPEQVRESKSVDRRADQYAVAVLLYEACAGQLPFRGDSAFAVMAAICEGVAPRLDAIARNVPAALADVVHRAMSARPELRYESAGAFARDLVRFATGSSWARWAREFGDRTCPDALGETRDDAVAPCVREVRSRPPARVRKLVVPLASAGLGALGAWCVMHATPIASLRAEPTATTVSMPPVAAAQSLAPLVSSSGSVPRATVPFSPSLDAARADRARSPKAAAIPDSPTPTSPHVEFGQNKAPILE